MQHLIDLENPFLDLQAVKKEKKDDGASRRTKKTKIKSESTAGNAAMAIAACDY